MKIKAFVFFLLISMSTMANKGIDDYWTFDFAVGMPRLSGPIAGKNSGVFSYSGLWCSAIGFSKYGTSGVLFKEDVFGVSFGYLFQINQVEASGLNNLNPAPESYNLIKPNQLLHGPTFRVEYTRSGAFSPYIGIGANLLALRGTVFELEYNPMDNLYQKIEYKNKALGGYNGCFSLVGGLRYALPNNWAIALDYELFLRGFWRVRYVTKAIPYVNNEPEVEDDFIMSQKGINQHFRLRLQIPLF